MAVCPREREGGQMGLVSAKEVFVRPLFLITGNLWWTLWMCVTGDPQCRVCVTGDPQCRVCVTGDVCGGDPQCRVCVTGYPQCRVCVTGDVCGGDPHHSVCD